MSKEVAEMNLDNRRAEQMQRDVSTLSTLSDVGIEAGADGRKLSRRETSVAFGRGFSRQVRRRGSRSTVYAECSYCIYIFLVKYVTHSSKIMSQLFFFNLKP